MMKTAISHHVSKQVAKHSKDFRSRTVIKEALMENDFLKNLSQSQVRGKIAIRGSIEF